ncbi:MAG: DNA-3-methyladenine glycosylase [Chthoniobacteraceae bacterium]
MGVHRSPDRALKRGERIGRGFFQRDPLTCARELIGCQLVWNECAGIIVETEAYAAINDEACHTFKRPSARIFIESHQAGDAYVYFNYGMYWLFNVLVKGGREDGFVLVRALEPTRGLDLMKTRRLARHRSTLAHPHALCSGPGKLTIALGIDGRDHGRDLCGTPQLGFRTAPAPLSVIADVRIGISRAAHLPWRFLSAGSRCVSAAPATVRRVRSP